MVRVAKYAATKTDPTSVMPSPAALLRRRATTSVAPSIVHDVLASSGQSLDRATRAAMESKFGYDFSQVRVHSDANAAASARRLGARAYAVADRLVFDHDEYRPGSAEGRELIGHELAHVAQWKAGGSPRVAGDLRVAPAGGSSEREADSSAARGGPVSPMPFPLVHRKLSQKGKVPFGEYAIEMDASPNGPGYTRAEISFTPFTTGPATEEIQFIQIVKPALSGKMWTALHPAQADLEKYTTEEDPASKVKGGFHVDIDPVGKKPRGPDTPFVSPDYPHLKRTLTPSAPVTQPGGLTMGGGGVFKPQFGFNRPPHVRAAIMTDDPGGGPGGGSYNFETVAYDKQHGFGYGTLHWGFDYEPTPDKGKPNITNERANVKHELSPTFIDALRRFQKFYKS
jgi:hypothetical protein